MERSNTYVFIYSVILVVVVAAVLSFTAHTLKDKQQANVRNEKMQNILATVGIDSDAKTAQKLYNTYITESFIITPQGKTVPYILVEDGKATDTVRAFDVDLRVLYNLPVNERNLPVYKASMQGKEILIIPLRGRGLWGPIWGYVSLQEDKNTIFGVVFDHQSETPGLGAEINTRNFTEQFDGKKLFDESGEFMSIKVVKGGAPAENKHAVDGISGGTITCNGVNDMLLENLRGYISFLQSNN
jgi:Na+-transporting NADH:ubiquinone oxidoreductase subunit C